jgi:hypothetical protein
VQGAELEVLDGAAVTLRGNPGLALFIEFYPDGLAASGRSAQELADFLLSRFEQIFWIDKPTRALRPVAGKIQLPSGRSFGNLYCLPAGAGLLNRSTVSNQNVRTGE